MNRDFAGLLHQTGLKATHSRISVLEIIADRDAAISQPTLEKMMGDEVDRVTLYRILKTFEEKGIVHKVIDLHGTANYAICSSQCSVHEHHDEHFHFNCTNCDKVYCLNDLHLPAIQIPQGFVTSSVSLSITGVCKNCNQQS
ncbi:transcriptional repressor [Mucilaginibacter sp. Bleaf8]|uniref:Fur family transcriptional regulator n=1 Tax=Mucilaginibacter sp. Bleaf8 TaxID=2834430 RepID=UPI001BCCFF41|nr:transcriptional repressor [Mucilaginibacter sp. Bleaf8]MBS7567076.1 transcriptional repressor [Mucilaginibacter sp. Bleaf8]